MNNISETIFVDDMSINTGFQGNILGAYIKSTDAKRVVITLPIEHAARFAATVAFALSVTNAKCEMYFVAPDCSWEDRNPIKLNLTRSELAFGPIVKDERNNKVYGGEYTEIRYQTEQNPEKNRNFACAALSPSAMLMNYMPY